MRPSGSGRLANQRVGAMICLSGRGLSQAAHQLKVLLATIW